MSCIRHLLCICAVSLVSSGFTRQVTEEGVKCSDWPAANVQPQISLGNITKWEFGECDPTKVGECDHDEARDCAFVGSNLVSCPVRRTKIVAEASERIDMCCPRGHSIAEWKVAYTLNNFVGSIEARCTDGTFLPRWMYGFNGTENARCQPTLQYPETAANPLDGVYTYRLGYMHPALEQFILNNMFSMEPVENFRCKQGEVAVGFGARSNCVSLVDLKVFCVKRSELNSGDQEILLPNQGTWQHSQALILSGVFLLATAVVTSLMVYVWLRRKSQKDWSEYSELLDGNEMLEHNASAWSPPVQLPVHLPREGLRKIPFCEGLADIPCIQVASIPVAPNCPSAMLDLPEECQSWRIGPASLEIQYENGRPVLLGRGGFGIVVLATYCSIQAAVKVLQGGSPSRDALFLHEINNLQRASKFAQIVQFYGYCAHEDKLCIVMEYMDRGDLFGRIQAKDRNMHWHRRGLNIIQQIASGLSYLHSIGLAHLDLSSRNILLNSRGQAKITDVAIGKLVESMHAEFTAPVIESAAWCAPERRGLGGKCGLPSDIWSLGTILWEVCKMEPPSRNAQLSPLKVPDEASQEVADMIGQCRAADPADRPTIGAFCNWLELQQLMN